MGIQVNTTNKHYFKIQSIFVDEPSQTTFVTVYTFDERGGEAIGSGSYDIPFKKVNPIGKDNLKALFYPYLKKNAFAHFIDRKDVFE